MNPAVNLKMARLFLLCAGVLSGVYLFADGAQQYAVLIFALHLPLLWLPIDRWLPQGARHPFKLAIVVLAVLLTLIAIWIGQSLLNGGILLRRALAIWLSLAIFGLLFLVGDALTSNRRRGTLTCGLAGALTGIVMWLGIGPESGLPLFGTMGGALLVARIGEILRRDAHKRPKLWELYQGLLISLCSLLVTFFILEIGFRLFFAQSQTWGTSLAHRNWLKRYWRPVNEMGFRDDDRSPTDLEGRVKILVLGDSFTAGTGIEHIEDRFQNKLGHWLGDDFVVMTGALPGLDTRQELQILENYPYRPDIVILAYYINDIQGVATEQGASPNVDLKVEPPHGIFRVSHVLNFVYFKHLQLSNRNALEVYTAFTRDIFNDPLIWEMHRKDLLDIYEWCRSHDADLIVVIFPDLQDPRSTASATQKVAATYQEVGVLVFDLTDEFSNDRPQDLVVSRVDGHPNEATHERVARLLYESVDWHSLQEKHR